MKKNPNPQSGFVNARNLFAVLLCTVAISLAIVSFAPAAGPAPTGGTLSTSNRTLTYTDPVGPVPNATGEGVGFTAPVCAANGVDCSKYVLTLDPSIFTASTGYDPAKNSIVIQLSWSPSAEQYGSFVEDKNGNVIASNTAGLDPETITIAVNTPNLQANGPYTIVTTLEIGTPGTGYKGTVSLAAASGAANVSASPAPRYQVYSSPVPPSSTGLEPSIGVDWNPNVASLKQIAAGNAAHGPTLLNTGGITMFTDTFNQFQVGFDDCSSPAINTWTNTAFITQQTTTLDALPIRRRTRRDALFTDNLRLGIVIPPSRTMTERLIRLRRAAACRKDLTTRPSEVARTIPIRHLLRLPIQHTRTQSIIARKTSSPKLSAPGVMMAASHSGQAFRSTIRRNASARFTVTSRWRETAQCTCRTIRVLWRTPIRVSPFRLITALPGMN